MFTHVHEIWSAKPGEDKLVSGVYSSGIGLIEGAVSM